MPGERVYVSGAPSWLPPDSFEALLHLLFNRPDLAVPFVQEFPVQANYRLLVDQSGASYQKQPQEPPKFPLNQSIKGSENAH